MFQYFSWQSFRTYISQIFLQLKIQNSNISFLNLLSREVIDDVDVFGSIVDLGVIRKIYRGIWIAKDSIRYIVKLQLFKPSLKPQVMFRSHWQSHVCCFSGRHGDRLLFIWSPGDGRVSELKQISRKTSSWIDIISIWCIRITWKFEWRIPGI